MSIDDVSVAIFDLERFRASAPPTLVLEQYAPDKYAWFRPETITDPEPDDALYWPTQRGRDYLARLEALRWLFL